MYGKGKVKEYEKRIKIKIKENTFLSKKDKSRSREFAA
jgi:hypothetical protein